MKFGKDTKMVSIRGKPRDQSKNDSPGPGYYKENPDYVKDRVVSHDMGRSVDRSFSPSKE